MFSYLFTTELLAKLHLQVEHRLKGGWLFQTHDILETSDPVVCPVGMGTFLQPTTIFGDALDSHSLSHVCTGFWYIVTHMLAWLLPVPFPQTSHWQTQLVFSLLSQLDKVTVRQTWPGILKDLRVVEVIKAGSLATTHAFSLEPCQTVWGFPMENGAAQHTNRLPDQLTRTFDAWHCLPMICGTNVVGIPAGVSQLDWKLTAMILGNACVGMVQLIGPRKHWTAKNG